MNRSFGTTCSIGLLTALAGGSGVYAAPADWIGRNIEVKAYGPDGLVDHGALVIDASTAGFVDVEDYRVTIIVDAPVAADELSLTVEHLPSSSIVYDQIHYWDGVGWFTDLHLADRLFRLARPGALAPQEDNTWKDATIAGVFILVGLQLWSALLRSWRHRSLQL